MLSPPQRRMVSSRPPRARASGGAGGGPQATAAPSPAGEWTQCALERPRRFSSSELGRQFVTSSGQRRHINGMLRRRQEFAANTGNGFGRGTGLYWRLLTEIVHVEIGINLFAERKSDVGGRRKARDQDGTVGDHFLGRTGRVHARLGSVTCDFARGAADAFVRVQLEDQRTAVRETNRVQDERFPILEPERLADI